MRLRASAAHVLRHPDAVITYLQHREVTHSERAQNDGAAPPCRRDQSLAYSFWLPSSDFRFPIPSFCPLSPRFRPQMITHLKRRVAGIEEQVFRGLLHVR